MSILINILLAVHVIVSILIILVTLMQRPKNEGLGAAFGGGMTADLFGAQTSNVLATVTRWLGGIFFGLTLLLSVLYARNSSQPSDIKKQLLSAPRVIATPTPAPAKSGTATKLGTATVGDTGKKQPVPVILDTTKATPKAAASPAPVQSIAPAPVQLAPTTTPAPLLPAAPISPAATPAPTAVSTPTVAPANPAPTAPAPAATPVAPASPVKSGSK